MLATTPEEFVRKVNQVRVTDISASEHNPRGKVSKDESFVRLVTSIEGKGILVPLVVCPSRDPDAPTKYELVDGERRFLAAKELGLDTVPAHVLHDARPLDDLRALMFHLHMTRAQWEPIAQCRALDDIYPALRKGLSFEAKAKWARKITEDMGMPANTARDRVQVLCWGRELKKQVFEYDESRPSDNIYSYVLAIETSIVDPSYRAFATTYYNHGKDSTLVANDVRRCLFHKTTSGLETGLVSNRDKLRAIAPLFAPTLDREKQKIALKIFRRLVETDIQFDDVHAEMSGALPEVLEDRAPKPRRMIATMASLARALEDYDGSYFDAAAKSESARRKLKSEFYHSAKALADSIEIALEHLK